MLTALFRFAAIAIFLVTGSPLDQSRPASQPTQSPYRLAHEASQGPGGNLAAVVRLEAAEQEFADQRDMWLDVLATQLIFVGDHRKAAEFNAMAYAQNRGKSGESDGKELEGYTPQPAIDTILKLAEGRRVLMLNEEHRSSRERAFANELLEPLRKAGFTHLALETIGGDLDALNERKYPLIGNGVYTQDPILGDLVRRAAEMGMGIVAYEADMRQAPQGQDSMGMAVTNWRERQQAENLAAFLEENPEARLIVWSGRHHMSEREEEGAAGESWTPMGGIFREITGIDPLTVDLMVMNGQASPEAEHKTYRWAADNGLVKEPVVFLDAEGEPWAPIDSLDAAVFFPRTKWVAGRPDWLGMGGLRTLARFDWAQATDEKPAPGRPLVIEVRLDGEPDDAIPVDRVIWRDGEAPALSFRRSKSHVIQLKDPEGEVLAERKGQIGG